MGTRYYTDPVKMANDVNRYVRTSYELAGRIFKDAAKSTIDEMQRIAPRNTGAMVDSLETKHGSFSVVGSDSHHEVIDSVEGDASVTTAYTVPYATYVEYGTRHFPGAFMRERAFSNFGNHLNDAKIKNGWGI